MTAWTRASTASSSSAEAGGCWSAIELELGLGFGEEERRGVMTKGWPRLFGVALAAQGRGRRKFSLSRWRFGPEQYRAFRPRLKNRPICILGQFFPFFFPPAFVYS
jgi:hypothetical protein